ERLADELSGAPVLAPQGAVLGPVQDPDDVLPALFVRVGKPNLDLADGLGGEEQPPARVVDDLGRQGELLAGPPEEVHAPVTNRTLRSQNLHALNGSDAAARHLSASPPGSRAASRPAHPRTSRSCCRPGDGAGRPRSRPAPGPSPRDPS